MKYDNMSGEQAFSERRDDMLIKIENEIMNPHGFSVIAHRPIRDIETDNLDLFLLESQKIGSGVLGHKLASSIQDLCLLNICVLRYLLNHRHLIPERCRDGLTFFWATLFTNHRGKPCVPYLAARGDDWAWGTHELDSYWVNNMPALILKTS